MGLILLPLVLLPIAFYTAGWYSGENYAVVTQWLLWYLRDMWGPAEISFSLNIRLVFTLDFDLDLWSHFMEMKFPAHYALSLSSLLSFARSFIP